MDQPTPRDETPILLIGGGGHAMVVAEAAHLAGRPLLGFLDDDESADLNALAPRLGSLERLGDPGLAESPAILCLGDLRLRGTTIGAMGVRPLATVIHPRAFVSPSARLEPGAFVGPGAIVHSRARIGAHAILNSSCVVEHDCDLGPNVHVAPGAVLGGGVRVGADALVGANAAVLPMRRVGRRCVVGAGAAVIHDLDDDVTAAGTPARPLSPH
jgi:sugar O-acyltransferase (sialic acid O-acetyltransferase NeuD family)